MIGTIRKHSKWMWFVIIAATIVSFLFWGGTISRQNGGGGRQSNSFGSIDGKTITPEAYVRAKNETYLYYLFNTGEWPIRNPKISQDDLQREIYIRLFMLQKAADMEIDVDDQDVALKAAVYLHSLGRDNEAVPLDEFVKQVLQPEGLTAEDFESFVRDDLVMQQLAQTMSLTGSFITPQEAAADYRRENQELSAQIVFFSATNYLSQVMVTPQAVKQFYTNYLAQYRLPDRVQVSYVAFDLSNYLAKAQAQLAKTNLNEMVEAYYRQLGTNYFHDATPDEAKAKIREQLINRQAGVDAGKDANDFANIVFNENPVKSENLTAVAKQKGLVVHTTEPFSSELGPEEIGPLESFTKAAFDLTPDDPFAGPIEGPDAVYVIAFEKKLPSEIPSFEQIHEQVTADYRFHEATLLAQETGTNFMLTLTIQMATGRSFSSICAARGLHAENLPPFSLGTESLPGFENRADLSQLKQAAFSTAPGKTSGFNTTDDGGFIVYVKSRLPIDQTAMDADLPKFTANLRLERQREAFNNWLQREGSQELRDTPLFQKQASAANDGP
jgi:peptidyl-prolyl cis-trans isomerase D